MKTRLTEEHGLTLVELMVAGFISVLVLALLGTWFSTVNRVENFQRQDFSALDELRNGKSEMTKELRFASALLDTPTNGIEVWIDVDRSGGVAPSSPDEIVTWQIVGDQLIRYENRDATTVRVVADQLVGASSSITVTGNVVDVVLVADADPSINPDSRTIQTQVTLRNA